MRSRTSWDLPENFCLPLLQDYQWQWDFVTPPPEELPPSPLRGGGQFRGIVKKNGSPYGQTGHGQTRQKWKESEGTKKGWPQTKWKANLLAGTFSLHPVIKFVTKNYLENAFKITKTKNFFPYQHRRQCFQFPLSLEFSSIKRGAEFPYFYDRIWRCQILP